MLTPDDSRAASIAARFDRRTRMLVTKRAPAPSWRRNRARTLPALELLERRKLLSNYPVTSSADSGADTLRAAITALDSGGGASNTITFDLPANQETIVLASALPDITVPVDIEGNSQPGFSAAPLVVISGASAGSGVTGITLSSGSSGSIIQSLVIDGFASGNGIDVESSNDSVSGSYIGTDVTGEVASGNVHGINVSGAGSTIGGTTAETGNIISGNTSDGIDIEAQCLVEGNLIGTDEDGITAVANSGNGISVGADGSTIGGTTAGAGNTISGNSAYGIDLQASGLIEGNLIGTSRWICRGRQRHCWRLCGEVECDDRRHHGRSRQYDFGQ